MSTATVMPDPVLGTGQTELLRFATAGSVDDGKSTLVGRLLYDTKSVLADQLEAVTRASAGRGLAGPDLSLLVDGLRAEREQGITIDVAYRYFATARRSFVLADTPGHVQYTRNTVTGASTAQLAVVLVDARHGVLAQTRRHAAVLALLRVPRLVLAINKIDLVDHDEAVCAAIGAEFTALTTSLGMAPDAVTTIPVSALVGDNVVQRSPRTPWYTGPTLLEHLERVPVAGPEVTAPLRLPVQYVLRTPDYRGYAGRVAAGVVRPGDEVLVLPGGARTRIAAVDVADGPLAAAGAGHSVAVRLTDDLDVSRGDVLVAADAPARVTDTLEAVVCWLSDTALRPGARLLLRHATRTTPVIVAGVGERFDTDTAAFRAADGPLGINDIARATLRTADPLPVDDYATIRSTGSCLLIDPVTGDTLAAGLVGDALAATGPA